MPDDLGLMPLSEAVAPQQPGRRAALRPCVPPRPLAYRPSHLVLVPHAELERDAVGLGVGAQLLEQERVVRVPGRLWVGCGRSWGSVVREFRNHGIQRQSNGNPVLLFEICLCLRGKFFGIKNGQLYFQKRSAAK